MRDDQFKQDFEEISEEKFKSSLKTGIDGVQAKRLKRTTGYLRVRKAKENMLLRERKSLESSEDKDSEKNQARIRRIDAKAAISALRIREGDIEVKRLESDYAPPDKNSWIFQGRIYDRGLMPVKGLTVAVYDERNKHISKLPHATTDETGFFKIEFRPKTSDVNRIRSQLKGQVKDRRRGVFILPHSESLRDEESEETYGYIHAFDKNKATVLADKRPIILKVGRSDYREFILLGEKTESVDPPKESAAPDLPTSPPKKKKVSNAKPGKKAKVRPVKSKKTPEPEKKTIVKKPKPKPVQKKTSIKKKKATAKKSKATVKKKVVKKKRSPTAKKKVTKKVTKKKT